MQSQALPFSATLRYIIDFFMSLMMYTLLHTTSGNMLFAQIGGFCLLVNAYVFILGLDVSLKKCDEPQYFYCCLSGICWARKQQF